MLEYPFVHLLISLNLYRFIRWDIEPLDEAKESLDLLEQSQPKPSLLSRVSVFIV